MNFENLPTFFEGNSRILKEDPNTQLLICKLKPTVFSLQKNGPVVVLGIDTLRTELNSLLCNHLHRHGVKTSTKETRNGLIFMDRCDVPPIEVIVKGALVGSPKHIYKNIEKTPTREKTTLNGKHPPYVRFDWRNPLPLEDLCMPQDLADYYIDTKQAAETALNAFKILNSLFKKHEFELIDICFFMNSEGNVICAEVSTDNCRLAYTGSDKTIEKVFVSNEKNDRLAQAKILLNSLKVGA